MFGLANVFLKPLLTFIAIPLIILTFGIAYFFVNVAILAFTEWVVPNFSIDGFWTYVGAVIVMWLVNVALGRLLRADRGRRRPPVGRLAELDERRPGRDLVAGATWTAVTVAANGAPTGISIFIASRTTSGCRGATSSPAATSTLITVPGIGAVIEPCRRLPRAPGSAVSMSGAAAGGGRGRLSRHGRAKARGDGRSGRAESGGWSSEERRRDLAGPERRLPTSQRRNGSSSSRPRPRLGQRRVESLERPSRVEPWAISFASRGS